MVFSHDTAVSETEFEAYGVVDGQLQCPANACVSIGLLAINFGYLVRTNDDCRSRYHFGPYKAKPSITSMNSPTDS